MPITADVGDVEARWRELSATESDVAVVLVADALVKLRIARPALPALVAAADAAAVAVGATAAQIQAAADWAYLVRVCIAEGVIRVLNNPDLFRSASISADGSIAVGYQAPSEVFRARLALDYSDLDRMVRAATGSGSVVSIGLQTPATAAQASVLPTP